MRETGPRRASLGDRIKSLRNQRRAEVGKS